MAGWSAAEGVPYPLGASRAREGDAWNFALHSRHATGVTLLLYAPEDPVRARREIRLDPLANRTLAIWHCRVPDAELDGLSLWAWRVEGPGPGGPGSWHFFDTEKVCFDPYAPGLHFPAAFDRQAAIVPGPNDGRAPLGTLGLRAPAVPRDEPRPRHEADLVIYEMHVKGLTANPNSGVPAARRGTYRGVVDRIPHLQRLGITAVELLPVFQFDPQEGNYWGYMPISFFSPHQQYATKVEARQATHEFRHMVRALHRAGIEVILDVVYNHTGEADLNGPTYSLRGIDNATYYLGSSNREQPYADFSGTGNAVNCGSPAARRLILDSMRHWVSHLGVDGFRFDLASVLARDTDGSVRHDPPIFAQIAADPVLGTARLIAEPWDATGLYQLGRGFPGEHWMQWNDRFRDDIRRFVRGSPGMVGHAMARMYGSSDLFPEAPDAVYRPWQSVNYVCSHDGFTLYDLVAYNHKHNWANGHDNADGHSANYSWNCGTEGDLELTPAIRRLRQRQARNFVTLLLLANGTPMLLAGDEFLNTQGGNNNAFNQDNETGWLDWSRLEEHAGFFRFVRAMIAFRKRHASIARSRFWREDIAWHGVGNDVDLSHDSHSLAYRLRGASVGDADIYVMMNFYEEDLVFEVQSDSGTRWRRVVDTARPSPGDIHEDEDAAPPLDAKRLTVAARSVVVLVGRTRSGRRNP